MDHGTTYQRPEKSIESNAINHDDKLPYFVPSTVGLTGGISRPGARPEKPKKMCCIARRTPTRISNL